MRLKLKKEQQCKCPLCRLDLDDDIVLDHDHKSGDIRATLHRWCNSILGKIENWAGRRGNGVDAIEFLENTVSYLKYHRDNPTGIKHPTHKTDDEKRLLRNKRARVARAKAKETI